MRKLAVALALLLWPMAAIAQNYPAYSNIYVNDLASILDEEAEAQITRISMEAAEETGVQLTVVTISSLSDHGAGGLSIEKFATGLFNDWGVGDAARNDGIMILVSAHDREMRIELGDGYSPVYDGRALRIIDTLMLPEFREGRMTEGILAGTEGAVEYIARPFAEHREVTEDSGFPEEPGFPWPAIAAGAIALFGVGRWAWHRSGFSSRCPQCKTKGLETSYEVKREPQEHRSGLSVHHVRCPSCGYTRDKEYFTDSRSEARERRRRGGRSGGSGGSSFGGGGSSGGGASGRW